MAAAPVRASAEVHLLISFRGCVSNDSRDLSHDMPTFAVKSRGRFITPPPLPPTSACSSYISAQTSRRLLARPAVSLPAYQNKTPCSSGLLLSCCL